MIPVVTPTEMASIDAAAPEPVDVLIGRAAGAVARAAVELLGGTYGRRVVLVAGPGNNGNDGRVAASMLERRGVRVTVHGVEEAPAVLGPSDLVIDAAFGTGFRGSYEFPDPNGAPVLAVDIPSGVSGLTGSASGRPVAAAATVTFAALKPGLVLGDGPSFAGGVSVADIGLDVSAASVHLVEDADVVGWVPARAVDDHKWRHAVWVVAGSPGMTGAARLCSAASMRAGAGYVRLTVPGDERADGPVEAVVVPLPADGWAASVVDQGDRFQALAVGPGLGREDQVGAQVRELLAGTDRPVVLDSDGLWVLGRDAVAVLGERSAPTVLTPHDGEFERLTGAAPGEDRIAATRELAAATGAVVLLKGATTVVARPDGAVLLVRSGDARLASAGTGDVLTGILAALVASGADPFRGAAAAAHLHGRAAMAGPARGLVASDVVDLLPDAWDDLA